ncbi:MAG: hypothetical protein HYX52_02195 [Chloroflexi bacterium]|nr:hypothetical protein [Chloroflexota bacterium]
MIDAVAWYVWLQAASLAAWPLLARALSPLDDRGWALSKVAGPLLLAWIGWLLGMVGALPYTRPVLLLLLALIAATAWWLLPRLAATRPEVSERSWLRERARTVAVLELLFAAAFILFALLRAREPAITGTEKPMDMAFLDGFMAAERLPTQDSWLAGYGVPYYYFGFFVFATLGKLAGVGAGPAYNLAAATVPALGTVALASVGWSLARAFECGKRASLVAGVLAALFVQFAGNLSTAFELLAAEAVIPRSWGPVLGIKAFAEGVQTGVWPPDGAWWWRASRVMPNGRPDGINEFPFFSAYLADLHPHFMAVPFEVLVLALAATHLLASGRTLRSPWTQGGAALALGGLLVLNTWDIAPFWLLYLGFAWISGRGRRWRERVLLTLAAPVLGIALFAPYFVGYSGPPLGIGLVDDQTPLPTLLVLFGPQIAVLAAYGLWTRRRFGNRTDWLVSGVGGLLSLLWLGLGFSGVALLLLLAALLAPTPGLLARQSPAAQLVQVLAFFAACILLGVELIYLRDSFGTRMNTVFKFHYNAWLLAGVAAALVVARLVREARGWRIASVVLASVFLAGGLVYPLTATWQRLRADPPGGATLDGLQFLAADERAAVSWLRTQAAAQPGGRVVIVEAVSGSYTQGARMATYSGNATVLGWPGHELQWRGPIPELGRREGDMAGLYRDADPAQASAIAGRYGARYVVVGGLERQKYGEQVATRFDGILPVAYRTGGVTIYRV